jgi:hypothetical protein
VLTPLRRPGHTHLWQQADPRPRVVNLVRYGETRGALQKRKGRHVRLELAVSGLFPYVFPGAEPLPPVSDVTVDNQ